MDGTRTIPSTSTISTLPAASGNPVTIIITRVVRAGSEDAFEDALKAYIPRSLAFPGHLGVHMLRPPPGGHEFGAVMKFRSLHDWLAYQQWPEYHTFLSAIGPYLEAEPRLETISGLESWFTPVGGSGGRRPARWKMEVVTWIGVCVTVYPMKSLFSFVSGSWPGIVIFLLENAMIVAGLSWIVMPALNRGFKQWLEPT
jgi:antibiotic biosynthesis monooxygenase (ABM) superfamily enzyme